MTGQELVRGAFVAALAPAYHKHEFLLSFEDRKTPDFLEIAGSTSGDSPRVLHSSVPLPQTLSRCRGWRGLPCAARTNIMVQSAVVYPAWVVRDSIEVRCAKPTFSDAAEK
jgi:hypothetical protein